MKTERRPFEYGVGALAILAVSIGLAAILYGAIPFDLYYIPAWIFGPLGAYTVAYATISKDPTYYLVWGTVMLAVAAVSAFYTVSIFIVLGVLLIVLAVIGILAYWRSRKR